MLQGAQWRPSPSLRLRQFAEWIAEKNRDNDLNVLLDYRQQAPDAVGRTRLKSILPLLLRGAPLATNLKQPHSCWNYDYVIAVDAYKFTPANQEYSFE